MVRLDLYRPWLPPQPDRKAREIRVPTNAERTNVLIEASAGTGKTQALAERLIALVKGGLEPHEIVALTFSRAAAGEIFERFVSLLAGRAGDDPSCVVLLRKVIASQHLSQIGTLDSFLMRIARSFPLELGLDGGVEIMDEYRAGQELARTSFSILRRTDAAARRAFTDAFALAMNGEDVRSFVDSYRKFVRSWQSLVRAHPSERAWGDASAIFGETPAWAKTDEKELSRLADRLVGICDSAAWPEFVEWVRGFRGSFDGVKGFAKKFFELDDLLAGASLEVKFNRKTYSFDSEQTKAVRDAMLGVCGYVVARSLGFARGVYRLISEYEKDYDANVRGRGLLVFDDVPRLLSSLPADVRLALEYRLDARIRQWALDEFQDTSHEQWAALGNLVDEAVQADIADGKTLRQAARAYERRQQAQQTQRKRAVKTARSTAAGESPEPDPIRAIPDDRFDAFMEDLRRRAMRGEKVKI